jgi:hypothetical protein
LDLQRFGFVVVFVLDLFPLAFPAGLTGATRAVPLRARETASS